MNGAQMAKRRSGFILIHLCVTLYVVITTGNHLNLPIIKNYGTEGEEDKLKEYR